MFFFALTFARMNLIQAYVRLYVRKYVFLPPLTPDDPIEYVGYECCKILIIYLPTVSKQGMEFIFAKYSSGNRGIAESRNRRKIKSKK